MVGRGSRLSWGSECRSSSGSNITPAGVGSSGYIAEGDHRHRQDEISKVELKDMLQIAVPFYLLAKVAIQSRYILKRLLSFYSNILGES
jgi:hypothetical protein